MSNKNNILSSSKGIKGIVKQRLSEEVRETLEETLNKLLDAEADHLCAAQKYEHSGKWTSTYTGYYPRNLETTSGTVKLKVPRLRTIPFETVIIERYKRRECSVEEALIENITETLCGTKVSPGTISNLNKHVYEKIDEWRKRPIKGRYLYVYLDGIVRCHRYEDKSDSGDAESSTYTGGHRKAALEKTYLVIEKLKKMKRQKYSRKV